jgi:chromosome segregation ATPase
MPESTRLLEVEKKVAQQEVLVAKFDTALDKISEVSLNVSKLLAVHEQRLESQEENARDLKNAHRSTTEELHSRISSSEQRLRTEMTDHQKEILEEIKSLRGDVEELGDDLTDKHDVLKTRLETDFGNKLDKVVTRVSKLERLAYIVIGGAAVLGFIISQAMGWLSVFH